MNLTALRQVYRSPDLRRRILVVMGLLILFRFLAHVPVPVPDNAALATFLRNLFGSSRLLGFADLFSGGALTNFSIIMMGVGPYINASIIIQLLTQAVPKLEALSKEGEAGRQKLNQYTRMLTLPLAILQSFGMIFLIRQSSRQIAQTDLIGNATLMQWVLMIATITGGSMLLMWLGEIITEKGVGNGISLIIFAGIVAAFPGQVGQLSALASGDTGQILGITAFVAATLVVIYFVVILNEGQRNIPVSYARRVRGSKIYAGVDTHLPLRVITAGVIPIIFALAFLSVPGFLSQLLTNAKTDWIARAAQAVGRVFEPNGLVYAITYFVLVVGFTYFYTSVVFKPADIAENLQKQGGFVPGIRPGRETASYLKRVLNRITLAGALGLGLIAVLPFAVQGVTRTAALTLGGTGLLIVVSVALETMRQVESRAITTSYEDY
ncbi:MAG TPA: preprotein translocase subunit SecY [Candidatus Saccharimonadales bacterium]|nr:preprotein translocase subunit SecY [Candidatus Saccharimonadales bacterium]